MKSKGLIFEFQKKASSHILTLVRFVLFRVEDLKPLLVSENKKVKWVPESAGVQFQHWLENLRDNSVSKQRFWGVPLPVWRNVDDPSDYFVVGSVAELCEVAGLSAPPADLHGPTVDKLQINRVSPRDGLFHQYKRVPGSFIPFLRHFLVKNFSFPLANLSFDLIILVFGRCS